MSVYLLMREIEYESKEILGVYSSREKAIAAFHSFTRQIDQTFREGDNEVRIKKVHYCIEEHKINAKDWETE